MLYVDRSTGKHCTHDIQNDFHHGFLTALECIKFVFGRCSVPDPMGELSALLNSWFKGAYC